MNVLPEFIALQDPMPFFVTSLSILLGYSMTSASIDRQYPTALLTTMYCTSRTLLAKLEVHTTIDMLPLLISAVVDWVYSSPNPEPVREHPFPAVREQLMEDSHQCGGRMALYRNVFDHPDPHYQGVLHCFLYSRKCERQPSLLVANTRRGNDDAYDCVCSPGRHKAAPWQTICRPVRGTRY